MDKKESVRPIGEKKIQREKSLKDKPHFIEQIKAAPTAIELAQAIVSPATFLCLIDATLKAESRQQAAVFTNPLQGFPTNGNSFAALSNGIAADAPNVGGSCDTCFNGDTLDPITLTLTFQLSSAPGNYNIYQR